ncbi:ROK family protein [Calycomorphotria hydatis]|uniref:N-acetyl-D-glucosamine kinase n=1 Tax=Calycomorphotria hydatis TaxID=2528027 RepID=A0A517T9S0_9PLAN|nr:ROK family protein [Calycomorphotria hydatis]QDT65121.1 N-acetyl-D-glucosamine kinase [Calycomorphotria hydatis]
MPADHDHLYVGIDVGGTRIKFGVFNASMEIIASDSIATASIDNPQNALEWLQGRFKRISVELTNDSEVIQAIGFACPGIYDSNLGALVTAANLPAWELFPLREQLVETFDSPFIIANDAKAACYGEYCHRIRDEKVESFVFLGIGTGVGAGFIINGSPIDGFHGSAAECGHIIVETGPQAERCGCGHYGHLEAYVGQAALMSRAARMIPDHPALKDTFELFTLAESGSTEAMQVIYECGRYLGVAISQIQHMLDPEVIVLGGGVTFGGQKHPIGQEFLQVVNQVADEHSVVRRSACSHVRFAELGDGAGVLGAAALARDFALSSNQNAQLVTK